MNCIILVGGIKAYATDSTAVAGPLVRYHLTVIKQDVQLNAQFRST